MTSLVSSERVRNSEGTVYLLERHGEHYVAAERRKREGRYHFTEGHWERGALDSESCIRFCGMP